MKTIHLRTIRLLSLLILCAGLSSCKENEALKKQLHEAHNKLQEVQKESLEIDHKLAEYRKVIPAFAGVGVAGARQYSAQLATELVATENQVAQALAALKQSETELAYKQKQLQDVKAKDPR